MKNATYLFFLLGFLTSCATVVSPTGGDIDTKPPLVLLMDPPNGSTEFNSQTITFQFDEYIQLKENGNQIIISPPVSSREFRMKKKRLELILSDDLEANTTYSIQFGNSISDVTEGNVLDTFAYVFSTGSYLDSLTIKGIVKDAVTGSLVDAALVMLYKDPSDSVPYKQKPAYFTKTNSAGEFNLRNLGKGKYSLFALKDANSNFYFDPPAEAIAYNGESVEAGEQDLVQLRLFKELPGRIVAEKAVVTRPARVQIAFNKPVDSLMIINKITGKELQNIAYREWSLNRDTIYFWMKDSINDSLNLVLRSGTVIIDTLDVSMKAPSASNIGRDRGSRKEVHVLNAGNGSEANPEKPLILKTSNPIRVIDTTKISLHLDTTMTVPWYLGDGSSREISIKYSALEGRVYNLCFFPGAWEDIYGKINDTLCVEVKVKSSRENGNLTLQYEHPENTGHMIIQLLDSRDKVVFSEMRNKTSDIHFKYIIPGEYKLRAFLDANANMRLDTGVWLEKVQPEFVFYYKDKLTIRANWDIEISWQPSSEN